MKPLLFALLLIGHSSARAEAADRPGLTIRPLTELAPALPGERLFTELDAEAIGLGAFTNDYTGPEMWTRRWREYILGTIGTGVTLGDIDGDQLPDLFVVSKDEKSRLFRNLGNFRFEDISDASGFVDSPDPAGGCTFVDVDNDGDLDLYLCYIDGKNALWINDGSGHFSEEAAAWGVDVSSGCVMASFADFDRDGDLDFYLQNNMLNDGEIFEKLEDQLFENRGDHFVEVTRQAGISGPGHGHSAVWWDFDEDGWPDIYVANDFKELDRLYRNNRDGTFTDVISTILPQVPYYSMGSDFGDINNDGHSDYWAADMASTTRAQHLRAMGNHDHIYRPTPKGEIHQNLKNALLLKLAPGHFADISFVSDLACTDWTWAPRLVDLNNDGRLDAFVTNGMIRSFHDSDRASLQTQFTGDDWMRVVFQNDATLKEHNLVFENLGDLRFQEKGAEWGLDKLGVSFGVAFGDLDLDGDLDLVLNNFQEPVSVIRNNEALGNRITLRLKGRESNAYGVGARVRVTAGDLLQVKELSLMRGYMSADEPILHFGLGDHESIDRLEIEWPSGRFQVFDHLPVNVHFEMEETTADSVRPAQPGVARFFRPADVRLPPEAIRREVFFNDFRAQPLLPFPESRIGGSVVVGDLNGDDRPDLVLGGAAGGETLVLRNEGEGVFEPLLSLDLEDDFGSEDWDMALVDWDQDGTLDLLAASGGVELPEGDPFYADRLYLNDGAGEFLREWDVAFTEERFATRVVAPVDFDGDGRLTVFFGRGTIPGRYPNAGPSTLWRQGSDGMERIDEEVAPGLSGVGRVSAARWADIDADGDPDLVLTREWDSPMIWRNEGGRLTPIPDVLDPALCSGLWHSLAIADLDDDGRLDLAVGNLGLNTDYRATPGSPMRLWYSDGSDGQVRLIETLFEDGVEKTREVLLRLGRSFPREARKILSYKQYSEMSFDEIFPDIGEKGFRHVQATELRSGVFWQEPDGRFSFEAFPPYAQSGRIMDFVIEDVDGDGRRDLLLSLDGVTLEAWSDRIEKGQLGLLLNRGDRRFESVLPWTSGLVIDGSPRGMAWGDLDGDGSPELIVMLNEAMPLVFSLSRTASP